MKLRVGCSGWSYKTWIGPFYSRGAVPENFLQMYSRVFDCVEIDSTFYGIPDVRTVKAWKEATPEDFRFYPKIPGKITHDQRLSGIEDTLDAFLDSIGYLGDKLGIILIQLPPFFGYENGSEDFLKFLRLLPGKFMFAVEFRHDSWFRESIYSDLKASGVTLAWSETPFVETPRIMTTSEVYLRLVGDRRIPETQFGSMRLDRSASIGKWAGELKARESEVGSASVFSNNHFQGFGPGTINQFLDQMGKPKIDWGSRILSGRREKQKTLF
ncbi:MAG: DUF72 domain-containing protein [Thermoplasmataceae archaeon]